MPVAVAGPPRTPACPTGTDKGRWLAEFTPATWDALDRPCAERTIAHALSCVERRIAAHDDERAVLVHGDVHAWERARGRRRGVQADRSGLLAEPEYDLGVIMREDPVELMQGNPYDRALRLARLTGRDPVAIWKWGVAEPRLDRVGADAHRRATGRAPDAHGGRSHRPGRPVKLRGHGCGRWVRADT